jgi:hypothetical protein
LIWVAKEVTDPVQIAESISKNNLIDIAKYAAQELSCNVEIDHEYHGIAALFMINSVPVIAVLNLDSEIGIGTRTKHVRTSTSLKSSKHPVDGGIILANLVNEAIEFTELCYKASEELGINFDCVDFIDSDGATLARPNSKSFVRTIRPVRRGPEMRVVETLEDVVSYLKEVIEMNKVEEASKNMEKSVKLLLEGSNIEWINPAPDEDFDEIAYQLEMMPKSPIRSAYEQLSDPQVYQRAINSGKTITISASDVSTIDNTDAAHPDSYEKLEKVKRDRVEAQFETGTVTKPIILSTSFGMRMIGGNTRATLAMKRFGKFDAWVINI